MEDKKDIKEEEKLYHDMDNDDFNYLNISSIKNKNSISSSDKDEDETLFNYELLNVNFSTFLYPNSDEIREIKIINENHFYFKLTEKIPNFLNIINEFNDNKFNFSDIDEETLIYQNSDETPEIKIKNENPFNFKSTEIIPNYLNNINEFDDNKFNLCRNCNNNNNAYYCQRCKKNLCIYCREFKKECNHELINLQNLKNEANKAIKNIHDIFMKIFINKNEIDKPVDISNLINNLKGQEDLKIINRIIRAKYINFFHYNNIFECKKYLENRYNSCFNKSCLIIYYYPEKLKIGEDIQIFGDDFVENNKDKLFLIINNEYSDLTSKTKIIDEYLEIIIVQKSEDEIKNLSCMFQNCIYLKDFDTYKDHDLINFNNAEDISFMFNGCTKIETLDLRLFGSFENVINMDSVFSECNNLIEIKGIELWNTVKVKIMASMFNGCEKFERINGIENFNTQNVIDFSEMFCNCQGLVIIPEIKNWEMEKAENLKGMFKECLSLEELPDISKWEIKDVKNMEGMFSGCRSLKTSPDFSKWYLKNVENINEMFKDCCSLEELPNISKWRLKGKVKKSRMFIGCKNFNK